MSVYIELSTQSLAFQSNAQQQASGTRRAGARTARRPLRGLEIKEDTYAILKAVLPDGTAIPLISQNSFGGQSTEWTNFMLQSVQEARVEKQQMIETFGDTYVWFFGESPRFLEVSATLINSNDFNWEAEFWANYDKFFRGTKLTELGARLYLCYDDTIVEGYMMNAQAQKNSQQPLEVPLMFRLFVTGTANVSNVGSDKFPIRNSVMGQLPAGLDLTKPFNGDQLDALAKLNGKYLKQDEDWLDVLPDRPLRGLISDNTDELVGPEPSPFVTPVDKVESLDDLLAGTLAAMRDFNALTDQLTALLDPKKGGFPNLNPKNGLMSPKEAWSKLKKGYADAKATKKRIEKTYKKVTAVTDQIDDFANDPAGFVGKKITDSSQYKKAAAAYEDATDWAETARNDTFGKDGVLYQAAHGTQAVLNRLGYDTGPEVGYYTPSRGTPPRSTVTKTKTIASPVSTLQGTQNTDGGDSSDYKKAIFLVITARSP